MRLSSLVALCSVFAFTCSALETPEVKEQVEILLKNTPITHVSKTAMDNVFEIQANAQIFYFHPQSENFFFGEIFNKDGKSITAMKRDKITLRYLESIQDKAILLGDPNGTNIIYEFTDPDCGYCKAYEKYISEVPNTKRYVFFFHPAHPEAKDKVTHILCGDDKESLMKSFFNKEIKREDFVSCKDGDALRVEHQNIAKQLAVKGTPTLFVNNVKLGGFDKDSIEKLLIINSEKE